MLAIHFALLASGCASWHTTLTDTAKTEADVLARLGQPSHRYRDGKDQLLEYMHGPAGQTTYMARIDSEGRLVSYTQVLDLQHFGQIKSGVSTTQDVLHIVGAPSERTHYPWTGLTAWSYPYKEQGVWDSMMSIYFDSAGIVRKLENGPDPYRDPDRWLWH